MLMPLRKKASLAALTIFLPGLSWAQQTMLLPENSVTRVSDHVYPIVGFPNIGIVVGDRATLVVDTGLDARTGAIVVKQAEKLATHFHPEHAMATRRFPHAPSSFGRLSNRKI